MFDCLVARVDGWLHSSRGGRWRVAKGDGGSFVKEGGGRGAKIVFVGGAGGIGDRRETRVDGLFVTEGEEEGEGVEGSFVGGGGRGERSAGGL